MEDALTYNVVSSGKLITEFDLSDVQGSVADLFKISPEKATSIITKRTVLKKDLDHKQASAYKQKLESVGLKIVLKPNEKKIVAPLSLSLEPIEDKTPVIAAADAPVIDSSRVTCEKCQLDQPKSNQCTGCGICFHKINSSVDNAPIKNVHAQTDGHINDTVVMAGDTLKPNGISAGVVAAVLGALLWKGIVVAFEYELGLIAWGIGGAIGFAVAFTGSKGQAAGIMCGVLALLAILGGKYMALETFQDQLREMLSSSNEEMRVVYDGQREVAKNYSQDVKGKKSLRQFMVDYGYSEFYEQEKVTDEEVTYFTESIGPDLDALSDSGMSYEQWYENTVQVEMEDFSTIEIMKEDFGPMDVLFLFLGVGTAFRLGRGEESLS